MKVKGVFKKIIFRNEENCYTVSLFRIKEIIEDEELENIKSIIVVGFFQTVNMQDVYILEGKEESNKYGKQYQIDKYEISPKESKHEVINFLCSDLFKGIGEVTASKIFDLYKEETLEKILADYKCLLLVKGINKEKAIQIQESLKKYSNSHETITYLNSLGFPVNIGLNIYNLYQEETKFKIEENIYNILEKVPNINFSELDKIAVNNGMDLMDERRIKAIILNIIKIDSFDSGNTYIKLENLYYKLNNAILESIEEPKLNIYLIDLYENKKILIDEEKIFLKEIYDAEKNIAKRLLEISNQKVKNQIKIDDIKYVENLFNIKYSKKQQEAIMESLNNKIMVITGGPGTGKTTLVKAITMLYKYKSEEKMALLAPTGRASKRLNETTMMNTSTIHRFLKWNKDSGQFSVNQYNKDDSKFIIIDEFSMVDNLLFYNLLKGLNDDIHLIIVGDYYQLPSVGPGQLLKDIIESKTLNVVKLDTIYRQNDQSHINILANDIKNKNIETIDLAKKIDFNFIQTDDISETISIICQKAIEKNIDSKELQVLSPMYSGNGGIESLNNVLQKLYNPETEKNNQILVNDIIYREKDKVIQLVNNIDDNVFNGDIGYIETIYEGKYSASKKDEIYINFDGHIVCYNQKDLINIKHAYAISVHKSQGSEFNHVVIPLSFSHKRMLYNHLIYTAITRAKKSLILVGSKEMLNYAINNDYDSNRLTNLKNVLNDSIKSTK